MSNDLKQRATVEFNQDEFELLIESLQEKERKHKGLAEAVAKSGYGKATTQDKSQQHWEKAVAVRTLLSKISESFI